MKININKAIINILELIECESINLMIYYDSNNIKYNYKIIEFKKNKFYIIDDYYEETTLITKGQYKTQLKYINRNGTGTNGTK